MIVRFLRSRLGDEDRQESDGLTIGNGSSNIILDHCSSTWSVDEALSTAGNNQNLTIQWCLIGEALNRSVHAKGAHGYGSLARANGPVGWYFNLWATTIPAIHGWGIITAARKSGRFSMSATM